MAPAICQIAPDQAATFASGITSSVINTLNYFNFRYGWTQFVENANSCRFPPTKVTWLRCRGGVPVQSAAAPQTNLVCLLAFIMYDSQHVTYHSQTASMPMEDSMDFAIPAPWGTVTHRTGHKETYHLFKDQEDFGRTASNKIDVSWVSGRAFSITREKLPNGYHEVTIVNQMYVLDHLCPFISRFSVRLLGSRWIGQCYFIVLPNIF